jgi:hypothetical protein
LTQAILGTLHAFNYPPAANFEVLKSEYRNPKQIQNPNSQ